MEYTVCFIFSPDMEKVLLLQRNKEPYKDKYNGIGGKVEEGELPWVGMEREVTEETGIDNCDFRKIRKLVSMDFPNGVKVHYYYSIISSEYYKKYKNIYKYNTNEGILEWHYAINCLDIKDVTLAGDGNIPYLINLALKIERIGNENYYNRFI